MTFPRPARTSRTKRALRTLAATAALLVAASTTMPAWADGDIYEDDGGTPTGTHRHYVNNGPLLNYHCDANGDYVRDGYGTVFIGPAPQCEGDGTWAAQRTQNYTLCQPAMQVFRFYGNALRPVVGWSTSMAVQQNWCNPKDPKMWSTSAYDVNAHMTADNYDVTSIDGEGNPDRGMLPVMERENRRGLNIDPRYALPWALRQAPNRATAGKPFAGNNKCAAAQVPVNPFEKYLADPRVSDDDKRKVVTALNDRLNEDMDSLQATYGFVDPADPAGAGSIALRLAAQKDTGIIVADPATLTVKFVDHDCASAIQYVNTADPTKLSDATQRNRYRVTGVCYIPIEQMAREYQVGPANARYGQWAFPERRNQEIGGGFRYSDFYEGDDYTQGHFVDQDPTLPDNLEKNIIGAWRGTMRHWYLDSTAGPGGVRRNGAQVIPAEPYPTVGGDKKVRSPDVAALHGMTWNRQAAANALVADSKCRFGTQVAFRPAATPQPVNVVPEAGLAVKNQAVQQAGGFAAAQQGFTIYDNGLTCNDSSLCDGRDITLVKLSYDVTAQYPEGWHAFARRSGTTSQPGDVVLAAGEATGAAPPNVTCHENTCKAHVRTSTPGSAVSFLVNYFKPAEPGQTVTFRVSNVVVKYSKVVDVPDFAWITPEGGTATWTQVGSHEETQVVKLANVNLTGAPVKLTNGSWTAPIIGAISSH